MVRRFHEAPNQGHLFDEIEQRREKAAVLCQRLDTLAIEDKEIDPFELYNALLSLGVITKSFDLHGETAREDLFTVVDEELRGGWFHKAAGFIYRNPNPPAHNRQRAMAADFLKKTPLQIPDEKRAQIVGYTAPWFHTLGYKTDATTPDFLRILSNKFQHAFSRFHDLTTESVDYYREGIDLIVAGHADSWQEAREILRLQRANDTIDTATGINRVNLNFSLHAGKNVKRINKPR